MPRIDGISASVASRDADGTTIRLRPFSGPAKEDAHLAPWEMSLATAEALHENLGKTVTLAKRSVPPKLKKEQ